MGLYLAKIIYQMHAADSYGRKKVQRGGHGSSHRRPRHGDTGSQLTQAFARLDAHPTASIHRYAVRLASLRSDRYRSLAESLARLHGQEAHTHQDKVVI